MTSESWYTVTVGFGKRYRCFIQWDVRNGQVICLGLHLYSERNEYKGWWAASEMPRTVLKWACTTITRDEMEKVNKRKTLSFSDWLSGDE